MSRRDIFYERMLSLNLYKEEIKEQRDKGAKGPERFPLYPSASFPLKET